MDFIDKNIMEYAETFSSPESDLLKKLNRETYTKTLNPRMLSGHMQGKLLTFFSQMIKPKVILEIGTFTGYATLCLAAGLTEDGVVYTIDSNEEVEAFAKKYFKLSEYAHKINMIIGDACAVIPTIDKIFDLVFIDADKENYAHYFDLVINKVRRGGIILADNVLWSGKVLNTETDADKDTQGIREFNKKIQNDNRVENMLLPFRDGLMIMRKL